MASRILSQAQLKKLLHYNPDTGVFTWKVTRNQFVIAGREAGGIDSSGYRQIKIQSKMHLAHRLVFLYQTGEWPNGEVDHINRLPLDNSFANLRVVTRNENQQNRVALRNNRSGYKGVHWCKTNELWIAQIQHNGQRTKLGSFLSAEDAYAAYCSAAEKIHSINPCASTSQCL